MRNLGAFAAPDGRLVFDINDFDETIARALRVGPETHGRFAGAGRARIRTQGVLGAREAAKNSLVHYGAKMRAFAEMPILEVGRFQVHRMGSIEPVHDALLKAERATPLHTLEQLTEPASINLARRGASRRSSQC